MTTFNTCNGKQPMGSITWYRLFCEYYFCYHQYLHFNFPGEDGADSPAYVQGKRELNQTSDEQVLVQVSW